LNYFMVRNGNDGEGGKPKFDCCNMMEKTTGKCAKKPYELPFMLSQKKTTGTCPVLFGREECNELWNCMFHRSENVPYEMSKRLCAFVRRSALGRTAASVRGGVSREKLLERESALKLTIDYTRRGVERVGAEEVHEVLARQTKAMCHVMSEAALHPMVQLRAGPMQSAQVFNHREMALGENESGRLGVSTEPCDCDKFDDKFKMTFKGLEDKGLHVATENPNVLLSHSDEKMAKSPGTKELCEKLRYGARMRFNPGYTKVEVERIMVMDVKKYFSKLEVTTGATKAPPGLAEAVAEELSEIVLEERNGEEEDERRERKTKAPLSRAGKRSKDEFGRTLLYSELEKSQGIGMQCRRLADMMSWNNLNAVNYRHLGKLGGAAVTAQMTSMNERFAKHAALRECEKRRNKVVCARKEMQEKLRGKKKEETKKRDPEKAHKDIGYMPQGQVIPTARSNLKMTWNETKEEAMAKGRPVVKANDAVMSAGSKAGVVIEEMAQELHNQTWQIGLFERHGLPTPKGAPFTEAELVMIKGCECPRWDLKDTRQAVVQMREAMDDFNARPEKQRETPMRFKTLDFEGMYVSTDQGKAAKHHEDVTAAFEARFEAANKAAPGSAPNCIWLKVDPETNEFVARRVFRKKVKGVWVGDHKDFDPYFDTVMTWTEWHEMYEFIMKNTVCMYQQQCFVQTIGIPQGLELSVRFACGWGMGCEYKFLRQLLQERELELFEMFTGPRKKGNASRFIDDVGLYGKVCDYIMNLRYVDVKWKSPFTGNLVRGIYDGDGKTLKLKPESDTKTSNGNVQFLDLETVWNAKGKTMSHRPYDKRRNQKYNCSQMNRFTPPTSYIWTAASTGAVFSETSRLLTNSSRVGCFVVAVGDALLEMYMRGMPWGKLQKNMAGALQTHAPCKVLGGNVVGTHNAILRRVEEGWKNGHKVIAKRKMVSRMEPSVHMPSVPPPVLYKRK